ncbi:MULTISPECIES: hypothetical protein [Lelliottia]|uniref:Uncharacterized protein n=1 Tax=Lelliottia aquatilis TaxID=2080838 RepID=A0ABX5A4E6_9ENTR|nr:MULTISPECIES: hypothetical protein [Lelliottia]POZ25258.1 hypothetical protein C3712_06445 [Lelliottia aquatilis]POZ28434.1 hypothetical protein C3708_06450 [Lelliottia sp. 7254-16]POZ30231.1 hypothetical protein C3711_03655 [Lelliottia aquatilis]POZ35795.1 hypothetical protein C3710_03650 [Lelliottia aquatilis]POZ39385.1 hypothetical protein C3709_06445 [Lelliottia aquatilis]
MDKLDLINAFKKLNIPENTYSIDEVNNETLCLIMENGKWIVFYSEKGGRTDPEYFDDEESACKAFLYEVQDMLNHL